MIDLPGGVPLRIHPLFWFLVLFISAINSNFDLFYGSLWAVIIVISVVIHELGHAWTAKACGQRVSIELVGFGGLTRRHGPPLKLWQEFLIVFNGPLAGLLLACAAYELLHFMPNMAVLFRNLLFIAMYVNFYWTAINLLPVQPLDGGHLLRILMEALFGLKGIKVALFISMVASALISLILLVVGMFLLGAFFLMFTFESYRAWRDSLELTDRDRNRDVQSLFKSAERDYHKGHLDYALDKLNVISREQNGGVLYLAAVQLKAEILDAKGRFKEAYELLLPLKSKLSGQALQLLQRLAYRIGNWNEAIALGDLAYRYQPSSETALISALCYGILGQATPAVGWLQCAAKEGLPHVRDVIGQMEFNAIRDDPLFQKFRDSVMKNEGAEGG
jgi:Zn-dependent protease